MDPDKFAEDLDPDIPDIKLRQKYLSINQRIQDISVDPISEDPEQIDNTFNFNFNEDDIQEGNAQPSVNYFKKSE